MFYGELIDINDNIRYTGDFIKLPEIGGKFIISKKLFEGYKTSIIQLVDNEENNPIIFQTDNKIYKLKYKDK